MTPVAISASVRTEQGATIMPMVRNEPLAMAAPMSVIGIVHRRQRPQLLGAVRQLVRAGDVGGAGDDEMGLDVGLAQQLEHPQPVDDAGRPADADDQPPRRRHAMIPVQLLPEKLAQRAAGPQ